jgi:ADP-ribosylglycohydrolase
MFDTLEETERVAGLSAAITHNHPEGIKGAQSTAAAIFMARNGKSKDEIKEYVSTKYGYNLNRSCDEIRPIYDWDSSCQGTVPEAMVAFLDSTDFESAIRLAVSLGGDSDTLACITGGIAEAFYKEIHADIAKTMWNKLPEKFKEIIKSVESRSSYCLPQGIE